MNICREVTLINDGPTRLWGINVGPYPLHRFTARSSAGEMARLPLKLCVTGWDEWVRGCERRRRNSNAFAIEYVKEGTFEFVQDGRQYMVGPESVFIVRLGSDCMMRTPDDKALKRTMIVEGSCLQVVLEACGLSKTDVVESAGSPALDACFDRAEKLFLEAAPGFMRSASAAVYEALTTIGEAESRRMHPEPVRKALELFESRIGGKLSIGEAAAYCSCSPVTLQRLFKKAFNETPMERFISMKMELAKGMLSISSDHIKEISRKLGYSNQLYFSTEFRRRVGVSPRQYRSLPRKPS